MDFDTYLRFALALILVLGLIALLAWVLRRFGAGVKLQRGRRLGIVEVQALGPRHRLILLRRDQVEHLVIVGPHSETIVESGITPPRPATPEPPQAELRRNARRRGAEAMRFGFERSSSFFFPSPLAGEGSGGLANAVSLAGAGRGGARLQARIAGGEAERRAVADRPGAATPPFPTFPRKGGRGLRHLASFGSIWGAALAAFFCLLPSLAHAQAVTLDFGTETGGSTGRILQLIALLTVLSLAPGILVMITSFTRIVVALSLLRSALGGQQTPPNMVLVSLAMFLTAFVMAPTFEVAYRDGIAPLMAEQITEQDAFVRTVAPFKTFMLSQVREKDLGLFMDMAGAEPIASPAEAPLQILIPAFMISELRRAFEIGFLLFVPFLIIDMVVASVLMSMGMMMLPPVMIALPFKLVFFVLVDGWYLVAGSLVRSFGGG